MDIFDNELEIIAFLRETRTNEVLLLPENDKCAEIIFLSIVQEWEKWTNSPGKSDPPPDFFSDEFGLMMDVMRVDDHGHIGRNGKSIINPTLQRESEVMRELKEKGIIDMFPNANHILLLTQSYPRTRITIIFFIEIILTEQLVLISRKLQITGRIILG